MKKHTYIVVLFLVSIITASCSSSDKQVDVDNSPVVKVVLNKTATNNRNQYLSVSGKIQATNSADLSTRMMGFIDKVHVSVGDNVKKGQLLVSINNTDLQAKKAQVNAGITQAQTAFVNAEKNYNRFKNLMASNSISQKEMDDMTANYQMAKAGLESAKQMRNEVNAQFAYSNIIAPFSGVITAKNITVGDLANPGMPLISLENHANFEVIAMVPETEISAIKKGTIVNVLVKAIDKSLQGKVAEISTSAKNTGGQFLVKINLEKSTSTILSGMFSTVQFPVEKKSAYSSMVLIPTEALVKNGQLTGIYTVSQSNTALLRWLRLGRTFGDQVEVLSGLNADESYILSAEGKLYNGAKITIE
jgi:RND family efflux transporter MFP subunit